MLRRAVIATTLAVAAALPAAAPAYPPITCGRISVKGHSYVVRTHGPNCGFAIKWARNFIAHHRAPKGYKCRGYGAAAPANCIHSKQKYFSATK